MCRRPSSSCRHSCQTRWPPFPQFGRIRWLSTSHRAAAHRHRRPNEFSLIVPCRGACAFASLVWKWEFGAIFFVRKSTNRRIQRVIRFTSTYFDGSPFKTNLLTRTFSYPDIFTGKTQISIYLVRCAVLSRMESFVNNSLGKRICQTVAGIRISIGQPEMDKYTTCECTRTILS